MRPEYETMGSCVTHWWFSLYAAWSCWWARLLEQWIGPSGAVTGVWGFGLIPVLSMSCRSVCSRPGNYQYIAATQVPQVQKVAFLLRTQSEQIQTALPLPNGYSRWTNVPETSCGRTSGQGITPVSSLPMR